MSCGGLWEVLVSRNGQCELSRACTLMPGVVCVYPGMQVRGCTRARSLAKCSSSLSKKLFHRSFERVYRGSFSMLMTWNSWRTHWRSTLPDSKYRKLAWRVKDYVSTWKSINILVSGIGLDVLKKVPTGKYPCDVCRSGVGNNSIDCCQRNIWIHKKCSGILGPLVANPNYICTRCHGSARSVNGRSVSPVDVDGTMLDVEANFCYLGDMLNAREGSASALLLDVM